MSATSLARRGNGTLALSTKDAPQSLADTMKLGELLAQSGFFSDTRGAAQAVTKMLAGQELGFPPIASMTGVYIVKGRVTLSAQLMAAAIKRSGRYDYRVRDHSDEACTVDFLEHGESVGTSTFTIAEAQRAGLAGGESWKKYPRNMLFARALSNGAKWHCPDVFGGPIYTPDELGADVDGETGEVLSAPRVEPAAAELESEAAPAVVLLGPTPRAQLLEKLTEYERVKCDPERLDLKLTEIGVEQAEDQEQMVHGFSKAQGKALFDWLDAEIAEADATADAVSDLDSVPF